MAVLKYNPVIPWPVSGRFTIKCFGPDGWVELYLSDLKAATEKALELTEDGWYISKIYQ